MKYGTNKGSSLDKLGTLRASGLGYRSFYANSIRPSGSIGFPSAG